MGVVGGGGVVSPETAALHCVALHCGGFSCTGIRPVHLIYLGALYHPAAGGELYIRRLVCWLAASIFFL